MGHLSSTITFRNTDPLEALPTLWNVIKYLLRKSQNNILIYLIKTKKKRAKLTKKISSISRSKKLHPRPSQQQMKFSAIQRNNWMTLRTRHAKATTNSVRRQKRFTFSERTPENQDHQTRYHHAQLLKMPRRQHQEPKNAKTKCLLLHLRCRLRPRQQDPSNLFYSFPTPRLKLNLKVAVFDDFWGQFLKKASTLRIQNRENLYKLIRFINLFFIYLI